MSRIQSPNRGHHVITPRATSSKSKGGMGLFVLPRRLIKVSSSTRRIFSSSSLLRRAQPDAIDPIASASLWNCPSALRDSVPSLILGHLHVCLSACSSYTALPGVAGWKAALFSFLSALFACLFHRKPPRLRNTCNPLQSSRRLLHNRETRAVDRSLTLNARGAGWSCVSASFGNYKVLPRRKSRFELSALSLHSLLSRHLSQ